MVMNGNILTKGETMTRGATLMAEKKKMVPMAPAEPAARKSQSFLPTRVISDSPWRGGSSINVPNRKDIGAAARAGAKVVTPYLTRR